MCNFLKIITLLSQQKTIHWLSKYPDVKINILVHPSLCIFHHDKNGGYNYSIDEFLLL